MKLQNAAWLLLAAALLAAPQDTDKQLEAAIHTEMVKGDLKGAIAQYRKIVAQNAKSRPVAARALYQLGQCQEKLGQAEARQSYEKLVKEYADTEFAAKARIKLAIAGPQPQPNQVRPVRVDPRCGIPSEDGRVAACKIGGELILRDLASGQDRQIQGRPADKTHYFLEAQLSPDGARVAYILDGEKRDPEIRVINSDGSGDRLLLDPTSMKEARLESWSADSRQFLAVQGSHKLVLLSAEDGSTRVVVDGNESAIGAAYFSPDGKFVAYGFAPKDTLPAIYVAPLKGGPARRLFDGAAHYAPRGWMKDGRLVFVSNRVFRSALWTVRMTEGKPEGEPELLYKGLDENMVYRGRMDQRGSYYYSSELSTRKRDVYKADLDFSAGQSLKEPAPVSQRYVGMSRAPAYSRDGRFLAYSSGAPGSEKIYLRDLGTNSERVIDGQGLYVNRLSWYPDGSALIIYGWKNRANGFFRLDLKTSDLTQVLSELPGDGATNPSFSPDGRYVYFKAQKKDHNCVARLDLQTSRQEDVFCPGAERYLRLFALSPDGARLVFGGRKPDMSDHIGSVPISGGEPKVVYEYEGKKPMRAWSGLAWTADGKGILYHTGREIHADDLWLLSLGDGSSRKLLSTGMIYSMAVHPNGKEIALDSETGARETEMWVLENLLPPLRAAR